MKAAFKGTRWFMMAMAFAVVVMLGCTAPMRTAGADGEKEEVPLEVIFQLLNEQGLTMTYGSTAQSIDLTGISCPSYPGTCTMVAKAGSDTLPAGTSQKFELIYTLTDETYKNYCFVDEGKQLQSWTFEVPVKIIPKVINYADIKWPEASPIVFGQPYGASTLSFPSDAYGTFDWVMSQDNRNSWYPVAVDSENFVIRYQLTDDKNYTILDRGNYVSYTINSISVRVNPASLNSISIKGSSSVTYTGNDYYSNVVNISNVQTSAGHLLTADMYSLSVTKDGVEVTEVKDAGTYTVTATPTDGNYTGTASTTFTVKPAQLGSINFNVPDSTTYNASDHYETAANVEVRTTDWKRVPMSQYTLSVTKNGAAVTKIVDVGTYTVTATGKGNYSGTVSTKFTVKPLRLSAFRLNVSSGTYSGGVVQANSLSATAEATIMVDGKSNILILNRSDFEVTSDRPIQDVGTYTISVSKLNNANYTLENANIAPATFTVTPAQVSRIVLNQTSSVYNGETVQLADLSATVYATDGTTEFVMPTSAYSLVSNSGEIRQTGSYFVGVSLKDTTNYTNPNNPKVTYTVLQAPVTSVELTTSAMTYRGTAVNTSELKAVVKAGNLTLQEGTDYTLTCDRTIQDAGTYQIRVSVSNPVDYANPDNKTAIFTVTPAPLTGFTLNTTGSPYTGSAVAPDSLSATLTAAGGLTLSRADYTLTCDKPIQNAGTYTIGYTLKNANYTTAGATAPATDTYTVTPATVSSVALAQTTSVYSGSAVELGTLSATVKAQSGSDEITLPATAYRLTCDDTLLDAGTYTIGIELVDTANYTNTGAKTATYTITPATVSSVTLAQTTSVYSQQAVELGTLSATVKAQFGSDEITLPATAYRLVCDDTLRDAGTYTIGIEMLDTANYTNTGAKTATYTITPATVSSVALAQTTSIYSGSAVELGTLSATVKAQSGSDEITLPTTAYRLVCDDTLLNAGTYTIGMELLDTTNYTNTGAKAATYTITPANVSSVALAQTTSVYSGSAVELSTLSATVKAQSGSEEITLPATAYRLTCADTLLNAGTYTIGIELVDTTNYTNTGAKTATYTITPANVSSVALAQTTSVYSGSAVELGTLSATVKAQSGSGEITLPATAYRLTCDDTLLNAGTYTIGIELVDTTNYTNTGAKTATYTITPANVTSVALAQTTSVYSGSAVELGTLSATVKAQSGSEEITLPATAYRLVCDDTLLNAGTYTIGMELVDTANYTNTGAKTATYTITPAKVKQLTLGVKQRVYDGGAVDLTSLQPTVVAETNGGALITLPYGDANAAYRLEGAEAVQVGAYVLEARLLDQRNYVADAALTDTFEILRRPVAPLSVSCGVTNSQGESVLGGPTGQGHRTITLKGEPNEQVVVIVNGTLRSDPLQLNASGVATLTVNGNGTVGTLTLSGETALTLDGSGAGQAFTLTAAYRDEANLRDSQQEAAPARAQVRCRYDMEAQPVRVAQLYNRGAEGVVVDLPEDMAEISFASRSDAGVTFSGSRTGLMKGDAQVIAFDGTGKLHSTALDPASRYDVTYTDLVGNTGAVENQTVERAAGTLTIASVDPAPKANKRIGRTDELTWTITCAFDGSDEEKAILTLGDRAFDTVLKPGTNTVIVDASRIQMDRLLDVSISYEDLTGTATFGSFVYDAKCDAPVLTSVLYEGCSVLTGIVEPDSRVVLKVNDARVTCTVDAFGTFAVEMPEVQEGDTVEIIVTDRAGNVTVTTCAVGPARETVQLKTFMLGKTYTDAHITLPGGEPRWTMITTVTADALRDGKVVLPIVAGNLLQVGTMTMRLDDEGAICYEYELNEGVTLLSEDVRLYTTLAPKEAMAHTGLLLSPGESTPLPSQQSTYYVTAEFVVEVAADQLLTTFQLETADENALKQAYLDRQNNRPLK